MKVEVNFDVCNSNALCVEALPEVFEVRNDGYLYLLSEEIAPHQEEAAEEAVRACPRQAITLRP